MREKNSEKLWLRVTIWVIIAWLLAILASLAWNFHIANEQTRKIVLNVANAYFDKDLAFRLWGTSHGGVYVPVSESTPPNPYLTHVPERDISTPSGRKLTLMNPAYMVRQVMSDFSLLTGTSGHLTSLQPLNPINAPDEWERAALKRFENGDKEVAKFQRYQGEPTLRLMRPFITQEKCLKCHAAQGYKLGDIRGGTTINIPMAAYLALEMSLKKSVGMSHLVIFLCGLAAILLGAGTIRRYMRQHLAMEERAQEQYLFTKTIINSLSSPFYVVDAHTYSIVMANTAAQEYASAELTTCFALGHHRTSPCTGIDHPCPLKRVKKEKKMVVFEHLHYDKEGKPMEVEVQCFPMFDKNGSVIQVIEYCHDISERKRAEKEKAVVQAQLQQAQKMEAMGTLAGGIAHDFNNILSGVLGYAELAEMSLAKDDVVHGYIGEILKAGTRAKDLVRQILMFTRKTGQEVMPQPVSLLVKEVCKLLRASLPANIEIVTHFAEDTGLVNLDPTQIHQIIMNLSTNAAHAMEDSGGTLTISLQKVDIMAGSVSDRPDLAIGSYLLLTISDTGCGMNADVIQQIFEPFYTTKEIGKGTGMGLSLVQGIATQAGGKVFVESKVERGTTFSLYLQRMTAHRYEAVASIAERPTGSETILFVDDEESIVQLESEILTGLGYTVIMARDSCTALETFKKSPERFDLVITDQGMPKMTGEQLAGEISKIRPDIPIILCTGFSPNIDEEKALALGIKAFVMKPVNQDELADTIRQALQKYL